MQARGLFAGADIERGAGEERGGDQGKLTGQHASPRFLQPV
jgi:hypothetical protein